jgi:hypothetical protein
MDGEWWKERVGWRGWMKRDRWREVDGDRWMERIDWMKRSGWRVVDGESDGEKWMERDGRRDINGKR